MEKEAFIHIIDFADGSLTLKVNNTLVYHAKIKSHLFSETYTITEQGTNKKYKLKVFKGDKIELYNQEMDVILSLNYQVTYNGAEGPQVSIISQANGLIGTPKSLQYNEAGLTSMSGYYADNDNAGLNFICKFNAAKCITDALNLVVCCFCYKALTSAPVS